VLRALSPPPLHLLAQHPTPNTGFYITDFSMCACVIGWTLRGRLIVGSSVWTQTAWCAFRITDITTVQCACFLRNPFSISQGKVDFRGMRLCLCLLSLCFCCFEPVFKFSLVWNWFDLARPKARPFQFLTISRNRAHWRTAEVGGRWLYLIGAWSDIFRMTADLAVRNCAASVNGRCSSAQYWRSSQSATPAILLAACSLWTSVQRLAKRCSACRYKCSDLGLFQNRHGRVFACCSAHNTALHYILSVHYTVLSSVS